MSELASVILAALEPPTARFAVNTESVTASVVSNKQEIAPPTPDAPALGPRGLRGVRPPKNASVTNGAPPEQRGGIGPRGPIDRVGPTDV